MIKLTLGVIPLRWTARANLVSRVEELHGYATYVSQAAAYAAKMKRATEPGDHEVPLACTRIVDDKNNYFLFLTL